MVKLLSRSRVWSHLYIRAFFRAGDYLALTVRLTVLVVLSELFVGNRLIAGILSLVLSYLLLFQLVGISKHYSYQYLLNIYPLHEKEQRKDLHQLLRVIGYGLTVIEVLLIFDFKMAVSQLIVMILIIEGYLPLKLKKAFD